MEPRSARRRCLLLLGAAALAGGRPVHEVEDELRRLGAALGEPDVQSACAPTGLFVSLGDDEPAGFESVGAPLRFDQAAEVTAIGDRVYAASSIPRRRSRRCAPCAPSRRGSRAGRRPPGCCRSGPGSR